MRHGWIKLICVYHASTPKANPFTFLKLLAREHSTFVCSPKQSRFTFWIQIGEIIISHPFICPLTGKFCQGKPLTWFIFSHNCTVNKTFLHQRSKTSCDDLM